MISYLRIPSPVRCFHFYAFFCEHFVHRRVLASYTHKKNALAKLTLLLQVLDAGLKPILCVGETKDEYTSNLNKPVCAIQVFALPPCPLPRTVDVSDTFGDISLVMVRYSCTTLPFALLRELALHYYRLPSFESFQKEDCMPFFESLQKADIRSGGAQCIKSRHCRKIHFL